jgi:16S rRNA (adenine1518-N6/adenine1519-N6)-dimethyltransferase
LFKPRENLIESRLLEKVEKLTETAFSQRRKMIRQSLKSVPDIVSICDDLGIDMTLRAENLSPEQYLHIAERLV